MSGIHNAYRPGSSAAQKLRNRASASAPLASAKQAKSKGNALISSLKIHNDYGGFNPFKDKKVCADTAIAATSGSGDFFWSYSTAQNATL